MSQAEKAEPSTDVVRGLIVANLCKLDRTVATLNDLVRKIEKDVERLELKVEGKEL